MVHRDYTDSEYLEGIKNAVVAIERAFYKKHYAMVYKLVQERDSTKTMDPQDIYQDAITVTFTNIKSGKLSTLTAKLSTYIYQIAYNLLLNQLKSMQKLTSVKLTGIEIADQETPAYDIDLLEVQGLELVKKLHYPCNEILQDWYIHQHTYAHIANKFKYSSEEMARKKKSECLKSIREAAKKIKATFLN